MTNAPFEFCIHTPDQLQGKAELRPVRRRPGLAQPRSLDYPQLQELFRLTAFWAQDRSLADLQRAISRSEPVVTAWTGQRLVGFARATSDGVYRATIWDVIVHPDFQGAGIGRKLVETVLSHPVVCHVERVYLMTTHKQSFYERVGFQVNDTTTMVLHNRPLAQLPTSVTAEATG